MTNTATKPNPADFSRDDKPGKYTATIQVRGTISMSIKAESKEDAQRQAEAKLDRIFEEGCVEIDDLDEAYLRRVEKDRPMYRVTREGNAMQVAHLYAGDLPRDPEGTYGF